MSKEKASLELCNLVSQGKTVKEARAILAEKAKKEEAPAKKVAKKKVAKKKAAAKEEDIL